MQEEAVWLGELSFVGSYYRQQLGIHSTTHPVGQRV
ncbi:rCG58278 [Rattus norvegicus]|uniref:RCG58278 n=1 Tax=Rattus norvegicus TaxID=10116 RepID=A6J3Q6_RAT|nr:rCG58278 [Rattus norvegicus]